jgi:hypothetical protein
MRKSVLLLTLAYSLNCLALAGIKIKMETRPLKGGKAQQGWIYMAEGSLLRIDYGVDSEDPTPSQSLLFQADNQVVFMVDHDDQEYVRLDEQTFERFSGQVSQAVEEMEAQIAGLPEGQRKIMEDMMEKNRPNHRDFQLTVEDLGAEGKYHRYEIWIGSQKRSEVWTLPPEEAGIRAEDLQVLEKFSAFYQELMGTFPGSPLTLANPFPGFIKQGGFPVRVVELEEEIETVLSEVGESKDLSADYFSPPADYQERGLDLE